MKHLYSKIHFYVRAYRRLGIMDKSASLSYYTIISVFPMVLILAAVCSYFVSGAVVLNTIMHFLDEALPYHSELIMQNLSALFVKKTAFSWLGIGLLMISAQVLYVNFEKVVNGLLHAKDERHFLVRRLLFFLWLLGTVFILFAPVIFELVRGLVIKAGLEIGFASYFFARGGFVLAGIVIFWVVLLIMPTRRVHVKRLLVGSVCFSLTLQLGKIAFKMITLHNLDRYNVIYGSLSSMILVTLWIFYFYNMLLFFVYWVGRDHDPEYAHCKTFHIS